MLKNFILLLFCCSFLANVVNANKLMQVAEAPVGKYFYVNSSESENNINQIQVDILFVPTEQAPGTPDHTIFKYIINLSEGSSICTTRQDYNDKNQLYQEHYYGKLISVPVKDVDCLLNSLKIINAQPLKSNERFSFENSTIGIKYINEWLKSFRELTIVTENGLDEKQKNKIGNLGADTQTLAFYNWPKTIEGTLLQQEYQISKLEYELALERKSKDKIAAQELQIKEERYLLLAIKLRNFLNGFHVAD